MKNLAKLNPVKKFVYTIRGKIVMLDFDLAHLYGYSVSALNQQVKRNIDRFPEDFMFKLTPNEVKNLKSQFVIARTDPLFRNGHGGVRNTPYAFTEQGVYMLSTILRSKTAVQQSIFIMRAFREMRQFIVNNDYMLDRIKSVELRQLEYEKKNNSEIKQIWLSIKNKQPQQKIFYQGQIYDAYSFICNIIKSAKYNVTLIDNYISEITLDILSKKQKDIKVIIFTSENGNHISNIMLDKFNSQYPHLLIKTTDKFHDRFIIIDNKKLYHIGASLKDAGNKCFAVSLLNDDTFIHSLLSCI